MARTQPRRRAQIAVPAVSFNQRNGSDESRVAPIMYQAGARSLPVRWISQVTMS